MIEVVLAQHIACLKPEIVAFCLPLQQTSASNRCLTTSHASIVYRKQPINNYDVLITLTRYKLACRLSGTAFRSPHRIHLKMQPRYMTDVFNKIFPRIHDIFLLGWSCRVRYLLHVAPLTDINAPPHSESCLCFELSCYLFNCLFL